jgi:hypothetical protein
MKKSFRQISVFCALLIIYLVSANAARACSCMVSGTVDLEFEKTPNVVLLELRSIKKLADDGSDIWQPRLVVKKVFKGNLKIGQELGFTVGSGGNCTFGFGEEIGEEFLLYLGAKPDKNNLWTASICSRSRRLEDAAADLLYLEKMSQVKGKTRLSGTVLQLIRSPVESGENAFNNLVGRKIVVRGKGKNVELKTDENGVYELYDLPIGKYKVSTESIAGYKISNEKTDFFEVEIKAKSHTQQDFYFSIDNVISGKLFDDKGKTLKDVCLDLLPARGKKSRSFYNAGDCTDAQGKFEFEDIPAGTYVIIVNEENEITSTEPFGAFYYPGVIKREDAAEITVGAGDFIENLIINAPQTAETITVSGVVLFENGKPAAGESVYFYDEKSELKPKETYIKPDAYALTDEKGQFTIRILKGQIGRLVGSMFAYTGKYENCPKFEKLLLEKAEGITDIETAPFQIEAVSDLTGIELKFPFLGCKKARND